MFSTLRASTRASGARIDPAPIADYLRETTGLDLPAYRLPVLGAVLERLADGAGVPDVDRLRRDSAVLDQVVHAVTVPETYLFRHPGHYRALAELAARRADAGRPCRVLCAGCATGEEAWTAAAVLARVYPPERRRFLVEGWDLDAVRLRRARLGHFRDWAARDGFHEHEDAFHRTAEGWVIDDALRPFVRFRHRNLVGDPIEDLAFDAVFFRNLAIYWRPETTRRVTARLAASLPDDGLFFTGPCDPVDLPPPWALSWVDQAPVHRREPNARPRRLATTASGPATGPTSRRRAHRPAGSRKPAVTVPSRADTPPRAAVRPAAPRRLLDRARALGDRGRIAEALALIETATRSLTPSERALAGTLLLELGRLDEALERFRQAVFLDADEPSYRYWLALVLDRLGRGADADREARNARRMETR